MNRIPGSFRDPAGFVFEDNGAIFRLLTGDGILNYEALTKSGLYQALREKEMILPTERSSRSFNFTSDDAFDSACNNGRFEILETEKLDFITYPYEWSFSQLKDAAILTLAIQSEALKFGMSLKDAVGFNIQFRRGRPVFIDLPSFEPLPEGEPWRPYRQFISHFIGPLLLTSRVDSRFNSLLARFIDGFPLDYISKLLPCSTWFSPSCLLHIHAHAKMIARYADTRRPASNAQAHGSFSKRNLENLVDSLRHFVASIKPPRDKTEWDDYYNDTNYTSESFAAKKNIVAQIAASLRPGVAIDLGANRGDFSRVVAEHSRLVLSPDVDPGAVERNYTTVRKNKETNIYPFLLDLCNPTPALGWRNTERSGILERLHGDLVLALALVHHLCIGNNVPMSGVAAMFREMGPVLLLEFVPKEDGQVQRLLRAREDIFPNYTLEHCLSTFNRYYSSSRIYPIPDSKRTLILFEDRV